MTPFALACVFSERAEMVCAASVSANRLAGQVLQSLISQAFPQHHAMLWYIGVPTALTQAVLHCCMLSWQ